MLRAGLIKIYSCNNTRTRFCQNLLLARPETSYSNILPGSERIRISSNIKNAQELLVTKKGADTVYELFHRGWKESNNGPCLGTRNKTSGKYEWISFQETWDRALSVGCGLHQFGLEPGQKSMIAVNCKNSNEFVLTYLGASAYSSITVPLYDHLSSDAINHIISQTECPLYIVDSAVKANYVIAQKNKYFPKLRTVAVTWVPSRDLLAAGKAVNIQVVSFMDLEGLGKFKKRKAAPPKTTDLFSICWTSGTSGMPKGALITHRNISISVNAAIDSIGLNSETRETAFSYMPTGHIYEILVELQILSKGGSLGFFGGDITKLMEDVRALKPSHLPMVPRLLNRLYLTAISDIKKHPIKRIFLEMALKSKEKQLKRGVLSKNTIWDKLVFNKTAEMFGGNVDMMVSSAAPLAPEIHKFFRCSLSCHFINGYGQTETGAISLTTLDDIEGGNVGAPSKSCMVKLVDVPEMGYYAKDDIGEICAKGANVIQGYYKNSQATKETFDQDGWIHTGDIGKWLPNGTLKIVDRKKNLFKLSQGEYLSPEKVENVYIRLQLLSQVYVDGLSDKDYLVAIAVPDSEAFKEWAKHKGFQGENIEELCANKDVRSNVLRRLRKLGEDAGLSSLEQIKSVHLYPSLLSIEDGFLTPTLKLKRNIIKKHFKAVIQSLYDEGPLLNKV